MEKNYQIIIESKYMKQYQNTHYRSAVYDDKNHKIITGSEWLLTEEQAMKQGEDLLEIIDRRDKLAQYGIYFTRKVFSDYNGYSKYVKSALLLLLLPLSISMAVSMIIDSFFYQNFILFGGTFSIILFMIMIVYLIVKMPKIASNTASFVLYEGDFYRIALANENSSQAQLVSKYVNSSLGLVHIAAGERDRQVGQMLLEKDSYLHTQLNKNSCWKILSVKNITKNGKYYQINCRIEKGKNLKIYDKVIYLQDGFNDYAQLIKCFEYIKDCSNN